jgi:hypothetical protein
MGLGIDLAREDAPLHAQIIDDFKDQLLIAMVKRLGGNATIPIKEIDETGKYMLTFCVQGDAFNFELKQKQ